MTNSTYDHIYFSPHLDDVVLSCGGGLYTQVQSGQRVLVVSFFADSPTNDAFNAYTLELKERWGGAQDAVAVRRSEDLAALKLLGADALHMPFLDCVYRQNADTGEVYYPTVEHIFGDVHPEESELHRELLAALVERVGGLSAATLYAPLTVGHHVDHILVQRMAFALAKQGCRVRFYEDFPYAGDTKAIRAAMDTLPDVCWRHEITYFDEQALAVKGQGVACYTSQISTFWANLDEMHAALRAQALLVGGERYGERYWQFPQGCAPTV
ncbi:MAG: PIG-L family deacetylase [Chloroflexi bacterium]|jgi:LmbE family N-acetylglucosaminyl deacetylase|nr:PIG-L family deacetylase [Chloroflexota bacterium]